MIIEIVLVLEEQSGFIKGRSCADNIFILKQLIEKYRDCNHKLHLISVSYVTVMCVSDRIDREKLWNVLYKCYPT